MSIWDELRAPFDPAQVQWRIGVKTPDGTRGMVLAYIDARAVMNRLDQVVGPAGWQSHLELGDGGRVTCTLSVHDPETGHWIAKTDGAGATDVEGEKGAMSDALKRAAVQFGIGRYLYDLDAPWVAIEPKGKSFVIAKSAYAQLDALLSGRARKASGSSEPEPDAPRESAGGGKASPTGPLTKPQQNKLWAKSFALLETLHGSAAAVEKLEKGEKFAPMAFALEKLGYRAIAQAKQRDFDAIVDGLNEWHQIETEAKRGPTESAADEAF